MRKGKEESIKPAKKIHKIRQKMKYDFVFYFVPFCFFHSTRQLTHLPNSPLLIPEVSQKLQILPPFAGCFSFSPLFPEEVARASEKVRLPYFSCAMMGGSGTKATCLIAASYQARKGSTSEERGLFLSKPLRRATEVGVAARRIQGCQCSCKKKKKYTSDSFFTGLRTFICDLSAITAH